VVSTADPLLPMLPPCHVSPRLSVSKVRSLLIGNSGIEASLPQRRVLPFDRGRVGLRMS
jgi:hypothetical protein